MTLLLLLILLAPAHANPYDEPLLSSAPSADPGDPFRWSVNAPVLTPGSSDRVQLRLVVPPGFVVYRDQLDVTVKGSGGLVTGAPDLPAGLMRNDPAKPDDTRELYDMDVVIWLPVTAPHAHPAGQPALLDLELRHQGCKGGLCYSPATVERQVLVPVREPGEASRG